MSTQDGKIIARQILTALYDAWVQHTIISLNPVRDEGGWNESQFDSVVDRLERQHGFIKSHGSSYTYKITPQGVIHVEDSGIAPEDVASLQRQARAHALEFLARLRDTEGIHAHEHWEKINEGSGVDSDTMLINLPLLNDLGLIKNASITSFMITDEGMRFHRGSDYEDII